jgi:hypothetical protein
MTSEKASRETFRDELSHLFGRNGEKTLQRCLGPHSEDGDAIYPDVIFAYKDLEQNNFEKVAIVTEIGI